MNLNKEFESARVIQTKQLIKDVFIDLYINRSIDSIGIKEITDKAGLNRGTFYIHYQDIYDLLDEIEDEIISSLSKQFSKLKDFSFQSADYNALREILVQALGYVRERSKYFKALLGTNGSPSFMKKLKQVAKRSFRDQLKTESKIGEFSEYLMEYIISANVGIIVYWLETGMKITAEELTNLMSRIMLRGPMTYIGTQN
jgi:AcrR family transcriptional regulator